MSYDPTNEENILLNFRASIEACASVNTSDQDGRTLLFVSSHESDLNLVNTLLDRGAAVNQTMMMSGITPLLVASIKGHLDLAHILLERGAAMNLAAVNGITPLFITAQESYLETVQLLSDRGAVVNQAKTTNGTTPLLIAADKGHLEVAQLLLDSGANMNQAKATDGATPLLIAADKGHLEVVQLLLDRGAAVNQATGGEMTASEYEIFHEMFGGGGDSDAHRYDNGTTPLFSAAKTGHLEVVRLLLDHGAAVNQAVYYGETPLMNAVACGHFEIAQLLLDRMAAVNQADNEEYTPLGVAVLTGHLQLVQLLLERGANITHLTKSLEDGRTPGVAELITASEEARALAQQGDEEPFRVHIKAAEFCALYAQWVPVLPAAARSRLVTWAKASVRDSAACFTVFFEELPAPTLPQGGLRLHWARNWDVDAWRGLVGHDGVVGVRRLIVSFLVHPKAGTRRLLRELVAMGDFGAEAGVVGAVPSEAVEAAARRAAAVRAAWFKRHGGQSQQVFQKEAKPLRHSDSVANSVLERLAQLLGNE